MNIFQKVTIKNLRENRTRTLVTIVGIILSAAMFSATTISISSLRHCLIQSAIYEDGSWYGAFSDISAKDAETLRSDKQVSQAVSLELLGYSELKDCTNESKPFLGIFGIQDDFTELMPIHLTEGRMPENSGELLIPNHLYANGGIQYKLNDRLDLEPGIRRADNGDILTNHTMYLNPVSEELSESSQDDGANSPASEELIPGEARTYTVVGFYERPSFEDYAAPAYTALTIGEGDSQHLYTSYVRTVSGKNSMSVLNGLCGKLESELFGFEANYNLLRLYGYSGESRYNSVLFGLAGILIAIIMFGSISLIYNAFSISVSERTRQFGLLASIGATRKQLTGSVLFEALFLSCIGIPLGILSGLLGIGVTFFFTKDMIASVLGIPDAGRYGYEAARLIQALGPAGEVSLELHPSFPALALAIGISLLTILISAWIPVKRAVKKSAIDSIRQTGDISIRPGKVKTSRLTEKLFGFEGMLAAKNYKRNRKKYRATVISLFLSIALFISASSWCSYLTDSIRAVLSDSSYDIIYRLHPESGYSEDTLISEMKEINNINSAFYSSELYFTCSLPAAAVSKEYREYRKMTAAQRGETWLESAPLLTEFKLIFLEDDLFRSYLKEQNLPEAPYFNGEKPAAVAVDSLVEYNGHDGKYYSHSLFSDSGHASINLHLIRQMEDYDSAYLTTDSATGELQCRSWNYYNETTETFSLEESCLTIPLAIGATATQAPALFASGNDYPRLFYPYSLMDDVFSALEPDTEYWNLPGTPPGEHVTRTLYFQCENHAETYEAMRSLLISRGLPTDGLYDYAASVESDRAMMTVVNVFAFGFITLISLIAAANVFNTISTNINLRRREFAMLKSVGMTPKGFQKMMNFECLLYGFKGLLYGLPVSFLVTWYIYHTISNGLNTSFYIPWYSIAIAVGSVFLVVFVTMLYSMSRIKKGNTIDVLKNENL